MNFDIKFNHCPEPWKVCDDELGGLCIVDARGKFICSPTGGSLGEIVDNSSRIANCVNAMAGMQPEDIQEMKNDIQEMIHWIDDGGHEADQNMARIWWAKYPKQTL